MTATLRANHARVSNTLTSVDDDTGELETRPEEEFKYNALNPALGITHRFGGNGITLFANAARNNRVPTVIELGCADPDEPCRLPAGLQSDPFLEQVKSTTFEAGARWAPAAGTRVSIAAYRTDNRDDILFGSVSVTGQLGFFRNFPKTRHQGLDAQVETTFGPVTLQAAYSHSERHLRGHDTLRLGDRNVTVDAGYAHRRPAAPHVQARRRLAARAPAVDRRRRAGVLERRGTLGNEDGLAEDGEDEARGLEPARLRHLQPARELEAGVMAGSCSRASTTSPTAATRTSARVAGTVFDAQGNFTGVESDAVFVAPGAPRSFFVGAKLRF